MSSTYTGLHGSSDDLTIEYRGKVLKCSLIPQTLKGKAEEWLESKARNEILKWVGKVPNSVIENLIREHTAAVNEGKYAFNGKLCQDMLGTMEGAVFLASLMFGIDQPTALALMVEKPEEVKLILETAKARSFPNA